MPKRLMSARAESATQGFLRQAFRPLIRIALHSGLGAPQLARLISEECLQVVWDQFHEAGRKATTTSLAAASGLTRVAVSELQGRGDRTLAAPRARAAANVLAAWYEDARYLCARRRPLDLPIRGPLSFASLVRLYGRDVTPRAILNELVSAGAAQRLRRNWVRAMSRSLSTTTPNAQAFRRAGLQALVSLERIERRLLKPYRPGTKRD
jgi:hypothetical protein